VGSYRIHCAHSDRGSQYVSIRYTERLAEAGIEPSVGSRGDSYDNALAETINGLYKAELIHRRAPLEDKGGGETGHPGMGIMVQPSTSARTHRLYPTAEAEENYYRQQAEKARVEGLT
jgi:putative transposase